MRTDFFKIRLKTYALIIPLAIGVSSCFSCESMAKTNENTARIHKEGRGHDHDGEGHGEEVKGHDRDGEYHHDKTERGEHKRDLEGKKEGEEDGTQYTKADICNVTKHGVNLTLSFRAEENAFVGKVKNVSTKTVDDVRVEVHLSNGTELGPTKRVDLAPGEEIAIHIPAGTNEFETWSTHAEVGNSEHAHGHSEGHEERERGEHKEGLEHR